MVWQRQGAVIYHASREHAALEAYEAVIIEGLQTFVAVGHALLAIREQRLYRAD